MNQLRVVLFVLQQLVMCGTESVQELVRSRAVYDGNGAAWSSPAAPSYLADTVF